MSNLWKQIKTIFSKSEEASEPSLQQTVQQISKDTNEPVIKKLKKQVSYRTNPTYR